MEQRDHRHHYGVQDHLNNSMYTDQKEENFFLIYKEIHMGAVAKSDMRKGFLIYEEVRKYIPKNEDAVSHTCNRSLQDFLIYEENFVFFFISALGWCDFSLFFFI